jgi:hypothetical protein
MAFTTMDDLVILFDLTRYIFISEAPDVALLRVRAD